MKITDINAFTLTVPVEIPLLDHPLEPTLVFVTIETDENVTGYAETGMMTPEATANYINQEIAPLIIGANPTETERIWEQLRSDLNPRDQTGVWSTAVSAVDIALWDLKGKYYAEPVWRLLGGASDSVPAYVTFGLSEYDEEQLVTVADRLVEDGVRGLKMVVGGREDSTPASDARRVQAVRETVGDDVDLMIDANYQYSLNEALELCNRIEPYHITWFEEPVYGNDASLLADLRNRARVPIAAGQNEGHRFRHRRLIEDGAVDIIQPNVCFCGGFTEATKVAATASSFNMQIANGGAWPFHNMHLQAAVSNGWLVEFHYMIWRTDKKIYKSVPELDGGCVALPEKPGLGLEPDWESIASYRNDR